MPDYGTAFDSIFNPPGPAAGLWKNVFQPPRSPFIAGADGKNVAGDYQAGGKYSTQPNGIQPMANGQPIPAVPQGTFIGGANGQNQAQDFGTGGKYSTFTKADGTATSTPALPSLTVMSSGGMNHAQAWEAGQRAPQQPAGQFGGFVVNPQSPNMSTAYKTSPDAYKTSPDAYNQTDALYRGPGSSYAQQQQKYGWGGGSQ